MSQPTAFLGHHQLTLSGPISAAAVYVGNVQSIGSYSRILRFERQQQYPQIIKNQLIATKYNLRFPSLTY